MSLFASYKDDELPTVLRRHKYTVGGTLPDLNPEEAFLYLPIIPLSPNISFLQYVPLKLAADLQRLTKEKTGQAIPVLIFMPDDYAAHATQVTLQHRVSLSEFTQNAESLERLIHSSFFGFDESATTILINSRNIMDYFAQTLHLTRKMPTESIISVLGLDPATPIGLFRGAALMTALSAGRIVIGDTAPLIKNGAKCILLQNGDNPESDETRLFCSLYDVMAKYVPEIYGTQVSTITLQRLPSLNQAARVTGAELRYVYLNERLPPPLSLSIKSHTGELTGEVSGYNATDVEAFLSRSFSDALEACVAGSVCDGKILKECAKGAVAKKLNAAFSGGRESAEEQRLYGANLEVDVAYQWLSFLLDDDVLFARVTELYRTGCIMSSAVKQILQRLLYSILCDAQTLPLFRPQLPFGYRSLGIFHNMSEICLDPQGQLVIFPSVDPVVVKPADAERAGFTTELTAPITLDGVSQYDDFAKHILIVEQPERTLMLGSTGIYYCIQKGKPRVIKDSAAYDIIKKAIQAGSLQSGTLENVQAITERRRRQRQL